MSYWNLADNSFRAARSPVEAGRDLGGGRVLHHVAYGHEVQASMARVGIGGMTVSTLITLILVPVVYMTVAEWQTARAEKKRARQAAAAEAAAGG